MAQEPHLDTEQAVKQPVYTLKGNSRSIRNGEQEFRVTQPLTTLPGKKKLFRSDKPEFTFSFSTLVEALEYLATENTNTPGGVRVKFGNSLPLESRRDAFTYLEKAHIPIKKKSCRLSYVPPGCDSSNNKEAYFSVYCRDAGDDFPTIGDVMAFLGKINSETVEGIRVEICGYFPLPDEPALTEWLTKANIELLPNPKAIPSAEALRIQALFANSRKSANPGDLL